MEVLKVKNIYKTYFQKNGQANNVLNNLSLYVSEKEFVSVIGVSGSGKSTLLDCISGLTEIDSGELLLKGDDIRKKKGKVAYMMQDDVLLPWLNLSQNVALPLHLANQTGFVRKVIDLASFFELSGYLDYFPAQLSGGMKQRASLMRAYIQDKAVMLLDEPFGKLDALLKIKLEEWFLDIWQKKMLSVLMVTHDIDQALFLSDRIYVLSPKKAKMAEELSVPFDRPRSKRLLTSMEFLKLKRKLYKMLGL